MPRWLKARDIEFFYRELMSEFGGLTGPADADALEAVLAKPRQLLHYTPSATLCEMAAAYGFGFARGHCFPDGNKRIALAAMDVFLGINGLDLVADEADAVVTLTALAAGNVEQAVLAEWLEANCVYPSADEG